MDGPVIQCAANFSEGRRESVIEAIASAIRDSPGAILPDCSADPDHNRMVATILGGPQAIRSAILAAASVAIAEIDLRVHSGVHPRLGAIDVVPLTPIRDVTMEECVLLADTIAGDLARGFNLPVYLYERNTRPGRREYLPEIRLGVEAPDLGPSSPHPTAGAVVVGARSPLVAYNIILESPDVTHAKHIAARVRKERDSKPELTGVQALGLFLESRNLAQVSMNLTRPAATPLPGVFDYVRLAAQELGAEVRESEIIGLIPESSLAGESPDRILWRAFQETQIMEYWLLARSPANRGHIANLGGHWNEN